MNKDVDDAARAAGKPVHRRGSRRVVMVSQVDAQRIESGEYGSAEEVLHATDKSARAIENQRVKPARKAAGDKPLSPRDQEILDELPPHFGKL